MKSLLDAYMGIFKDEKKWKYYTKLRIDNPPFENEVNAWSFIEDYYKAGEKQRVFDSKVPRDKLRNLHSVSVFFLGILLSEYLFEEDYKKNELKPDFRYLWFLTSLYHDYGYLFENDKENYPLKKYKELSDFNTHPYITHNLLSEENNNIFSEPFDIETIEKYYKYCVEKREMLNHGIIGGILFYDRLVQNFCQIYLNHYGVALDFDNPKKFFKYKNLYYRFSHIKSFAEIARKIIIHNIWFCPENDKELKKIYIKYQLKSLISRNGDRNHLRKKDQFLFLLILVDTIEPIKFFNNINSKCVLEGISINPLENSIEITVLGKCINPKHWFNKIMDLGNWVKVSVKPDGDRKLIISNYK